MTITALPEAPSRSDAPADFIAKADAFLAALVIMVDEINATAAGFEVELWVSGTSYAQYEMVYSPIDFATYRRITAGAGTTDPSAAPSVWAPVVDFPDPVFPPGHFYGGILSNNVADATNDLDITAFKGRDAANAYDIVVAARIKRLDANWAAGTNQGGRYSGAAIANTTYGVWACIKAAEADGDIYLYPNSGAPTAATVLTALQAETGGASYVGVRWLGAIIRAGGVILPFIQNEDYFELLTPVLDANNVTVGTTAVTQTLASIPLGRIVRAIMNMTHMPTTAAAGLYSSNLATADVAAIAAGTHTAPLAIGGISVNAPGSGASLMNTGQTEEFTNTSAQIRLRSSAASSTVDIATRGWIDVSRRS